MFQTIKCISCFDHNILLLQTINYIIKYDLFNYYANLSGIYLYFISYKRDNFKSWGVKYSKNMLHQNINTLSKINTNDKSLI